LSYIAASKRSISVEFGGQKSDQSAQKYIFFVKTAKNLSVFQKNIANAVYKKMFI
jgi:hypothetical protein